MDTELFTHQYSTRPAGKKNIMPPKTNGMMFFFPAGLVLYWCVNNSVSIAQQRYITKKLDKEAAAASR